MPVNNSGMVKVKKDTLIGGLLGVLGTIVYLLTMEPTVSFWDSGEFIAVAALLQVGHPPGAPLYTLVAHLFTFFAGADPMAVARCCNALSAVAGGATVMFLYWTIVLIDDPRRAESGQRSPIVNLPALVGALCYLFCDTAWFSAAESEVYSLAMLIASVILWAALRWQKSGESRWLLLIALLSGMGACVHLLTLLSLPAVLVLVGIKGISKHPWGFYILVLAFFLVGLTPYLTVPIRAAAGTPINEGKPNTAAAFKSYLTREQYEHAPLYPRMWRHHPNDATYAKPWCGGDTNVWGNVKYYCSYQLNYMYLRYLMWNFSGRFNDRQGYGSLQNGQFITGIPPLDGLLVGTSARLPESLPTRGHNCYFMLPLLLGIFGMCALYRRRRMFWTVMALFLMGGIVLSLYLNHPAYEPRERDYAYILSFYAFAIFIAFGARRIIDYWLKVIEKRKPSNSQFSILNSQFPILLLAVPLLMAFQNWDDHDRSGRYIAHDAGKNILNSCGHSAKGCVLFTYGDNDTFPLWYLQTVEKERLDVRVENIGLMGWHNFISLLEESISQERPVYFTHYAYNQYERYFPGQLLLEGNAYRMRLGSGDWEQTADTVDCDAFFFHVVEEMGWHSLEGVYVDETCCKFLEQYWRDIVVLADNLADRQQTKQACVVLDKTMAEIPLDHIQDVTLMAHIAQSYDRAGDAAGAQYVRNHLRKILGDQLDYYHTLSPRLQRSIPYTLGPRESLWEELVSAQRPVR